MLGWWWGGEEADDLEIGREGVLLRQAATENACTRRARPPPLYCPLPLACCKHKVWPRS